MKLLDIKNLSIAFGKSYALRNLNFSIEKGECVALVGESGSGKSLTALAIMQLLPFAAAVASDSEVIFQSQDLLKFSEKNMREIRGRKIGMIFQDAMTAFNPVLTIGYQIVEALHCHTGASKKSAKIRAKHYLAEVGIQDPERVFNSYAHQLSGGMRQRAMIAMAICCEPELIIADEPTTALDVTLQLQILNLLKGLQKKYKTSFLFISHDLAIVKQLADKVVVLRKGELVESQTALMFYQQPQHEYSKKLLDSIPPLVSQLNSQNTQVVLSIDDLSVYFSDKRQFPYFRKPKILKAVDKVSLAVNAGETLALVGESGSGKTTVAKALVKLYKPSDGEVNFVSDNFHRDIQMIFQDPYSALNPRIMVADSLMEGMKLWHTEKNKTACLAKVDELFNLVKLDPARKWSYPHEFSGGERQRLCIARALALDPKILILDEPTSALDVSIQKQILDLLKEIQSKKKIAYLLITHNFSVVAYMAHSIAVMYHGKVVESGSVKEILENPQQEYTRRLLGAVLV